MAYNYLTPFVPPGANIITPTITRQGYNYVHTKRAISDWTPLDSPLWARLKFGTAAAQTEQSFFVDAYKVPSGRGTSVAMGTLVGTPTATQPTNLVAGSTPLSNSNTNNRGYIKNQLDKRRFTVFVGQEVELWGNSATGGMIPSEKGRELQRKTKLEWAQVEYDLYTNTSQVFDLQDATTAGVAAGIPNILAGTGQALENWGNLGWVPNVNIKAGGTNGTQKVAFQPTNSVTEVTEEIFQQGCMFLNKTGSGKDVHFFVPDVYHNFMADQWNGRPNVAVNTDESKRGLDMGFERYRVVSGIEATIVPNRTQSDEVLLVLDLSGWEKRMGLPFGVYDLPQYVPDHAYCGQFSWTVLGDPRLGLTWFTPQIPS